tara:strand:- start:253 stop:1146 length:894 start_codon:yes stop_codon:yes gene_type:complete
MGTSEDILNNLKKKGHRGSTKVLQLPKHHEQQPLLPSEISYVPELLGSAWIPRRNNGQTVFKRKFGALTFITQSGVHEDLSPVGLPTGVIPRKILTRLCSLAILRNNPEVNVRSVAELLSDTNLTYNGQMVKRIRNQLLKLALCRVDIQFDSGKKKVRHFGRIFDQLELEIQDNQLTLLPNKIYFDKEFFDRILKEEKFGYFADELMEAKTSMQHDIYLWLIRRTGNLIIDDGYFLSYETLHPQFANSPTQQMCDFRKRFKEALRAVVKISGMRVDIERKGIKLFPPKQRKFRWKKF